MERLKPGDIVVWADTPEGKDCRERYTPGPYVIKAHYNATCITVAHLDGSPVYLRPYDAPLGSPKSQLHKATHHDKFRLDRFLDAAKKANESNG